MKKEHIIKILDTHYSKSHT